MTHRLFDGELRAASITASAPSPRFNTQASNFSRRKRSAAFDDIATDSMPYCRKHSTSSARADSFTSTSAVRAAAFRTRGAGGRTEAKVFSMSRGMTHNYKFILACPQHLGKAQRAIREVLKSHYPDCTAGPQELEIAHLP